MSPGKKTKKTLTCVFTVANVMHGNANKGQPFRINTCIDIFGRIAFL